MMMMKGEYSLSLEPSSCEQHWLTHLVSLGMRDAIAIET